MTSAIVVTQRAREIFHDAIEQYQPDQWPAFLDSACQADEALRRQVERLLAAHGELNSFMGQPAVAAEATTDRTIEQPGILIGHYKLLEQIGEGGMGLVFMAEQQQPIRRLVALKLVKPGMDTKQVIARFEAERQALAMMDHPNIAKVHDAGTTETGRPFFVMELVRGIPVNEFCDQQKLTVRQRLELFAQVCQAVQHAHQKGIIHRDLKPTNVLVTKADTVPLPKVIDFGIAKALGASLTDHTLHTGFAQLVGTPMYMSPEQAEMNHFGVDTRSDVYSLGVLLYELLTSTTPFDKESLSKAGLDEMRRMIREDDPPRPSHRISTLGAQASSTISQQRGLDERHLGRVLRGELDWIVMKALEKDRSRRYESASALAADIQRYLSDEPVLACPPTAMYRFQKFAKKHKPAIFTAAAIALCLLLGTTVSAWQAARATSAEAQASANEQKAVANEQKANANAAAAQEKEQEAIKQRDEVKALADKLAAKEEELQRTLYADHIYMAKEAWDAGNVDRATSLLKRHLPQADESDRRGFEWHYLNRLSNIGPLVSIKGPPMLHPQSFALDPERMRLIAYVPAGSISRNGERINEPTLKVWNLQTGQVELTAALSGAPNNPTPGNTPVFSPDATRMTFNSTWDYNINAYVPTDVKVWNTLTGKEILSCSGVMERVAFSSDSKLLATPTADQTIKLWDLESGQERSILKGQLELPHALAFSHDGKRLAAAGNKWDKMKKVAVAGEIKIWEVQTGEQVQTLKGHSEWMHQLVFSPDGQCLASSAEGTELIKIWDATTGNELKTFQLDAAIEKLQFSADGTRLIGSGDKKEQDEYVDYAKIWNIQTGQELLSFKNCSLEFTPDGKRVAVTDGARAKVFDANTGQLMISVAGAGGKLAFSPDSKRLAAQSGGMRIWDLETGDEINHLKGFIGTSILAFSQNGKRLIGSNQFTTEVWDAEAKQVSAKELTFPGVNRQPGFGGPSSAVFSSDFTRLAGISYKKIKIFDGQSGQELRTLPGHENNIMCVAISSDGKRVASSDGHGSLSANEKPGVVKVWDADSGSELFTIKGHERSIGFLAFSPDGTKLAGSASDRTVKIWDARTGSELHTLGEKSTMISSIFRLVFSPDSKRLVAAAKIWNVESGQELVIPKGRALGAAQSSIAFSPDGKLFAGGGGTVADAQTGEALFTVERRGNRSGNSWLTFSPDGKRLASSAGIWDAQTGQELLTFGDSTRAPGSGQVAFSPDGHRLAVVSWNGGGVTIYDATPLPDKP